MDPSEQLREKALGAIPPPTPQYRKPRLTPGRLVYLFYHAPVGAFKKGVGKTVRGWRGKRRLARAVSAFELREPPTAANAEPLTLHLLIGARFLAEACLVSHSLAWAAGRPVEPRFYDDGTLTADDTALLRAKLPRAHFVMIDEIEARVAERLPESRYPCLRRLRPAYPHLRKLTDLHQFPGEWKLVSDADVLFFNRPKELLAHLAAPRATHMVDIQPAYGVPKDILDRLAGRPVHPQANVGLTHLRSSGVDWDFVEHCAATILATHGFSYYLEQALMAVLLARAEAVPLGPDYVVYPDVATARAARSAALHYVDDSRSYYYDFAWRQVLERSRP